MRVRIRVRVRDWPLLRGVHSIVGASRFMSFDLLAAWQVPEQELPGLCIMAITVATGFSRTFLAIDEALSIRAASTIDEGTKIGSKYNTGTKRSSPRQEFA